MAEGLTIARLNILRLNAGRLNYAPEIAPPGLPLLIEPIDGAVHVSASPLLDWATQPGDLGPFHYDVYLGVEPEPPLVQRALPLSFYQVPALLGDTTFYWRVVVHNPAGSTSSAIARFTTGARFAAVYVDGIDVTLDHVFANVPIRYEDQLNARTSLGVTFESQVGGWAPDDGAEIIVVDGARRVFGGMLVEPEVSVVPGTDRVLFTCNASDFSAICDRRLVARAYTQQTVGAIVRHIVASDLTDEHIDVSGVEEGPVVVKAIFNWVSATEAFNQLAELSGMAWWIDPYRALQFRARTSIQAVGPFTPDRVGSVVIRPDRSQYRNAQVLRFGGGFTDPRTESFVGDGERQTFTLAFVAGTAPTITVNGVAKTVGIKGVETGKEWYWNKGDANISQADELPPLATSEVLAVTYRGLFAGIITAANGAEISSRRAIEGGSGRYMRVEERANTQTVEAAVQVAQALLDRFDQIGRVLTCQTEIPGYAPGQLVRVTLPDYGIEDEEFLIETVTADIPTGNETFWYELRALSGDPYGGWQTYFRRLNRLGREYVINENEVVIGLNQWADGVMASEAFAVAAPPAPPVSDIGNARIGYSVIGAHP